MSVSFKLAISCILVFLVTANFPNTCYSQNGCVTRYHAFDDFDWVHTSDTDSITIDRYGYGYRVPSIFDTDEVRAAMVRTLKTCDTSLFRYGDSPESIDDSNIVLRIEYFPTKSDSVAILKYESNLVRPYQFIACDLRRSKIYPVSATCSSAFLDSFNDFIADESELMSMAVKCKAYLIVALLYGYTDLFIVHSWDDVAVGHALTCWGSSKVPVELYSGLELYLENPSGDEALISGVDSEIFKSFYPRAIFFEYEEVIDEVQINVPVSESSDSGTTVRFQVYLQPLGEIADWNVKFSLNGKVISAHYAGVPTFLQYHGDYSKFESPFYFWRKK